MTTVASQSVLAKLAEAIGITEENSIYRHVAVRRRLDEVLGSADGEARQVVERLTLPWMLYQRYVAPQSVEDPPIDEDGEEENEPGVDVGPLPAAERRKGLTATKGYFQTLLFALAYLREPRKKAEIVEHLGSVAPDSNATSRGVILNSLQSEFGAVSKVADKYVLTESGQKTVETQDATPLAPWLLHRILGPDLAISALRERGTLANGDLIEVIRSANPTWTSTFMPMSIMSWLRSMDVIQSADGMYSLTARGHQWAALITWSPQRLPADASEPPARATLNFPPVASIVNSIAGQGVVFPEGLIPTLHSGLWAPGRRHFAVLTGLSGSGKTLLAREYAKALVPDNPEAHLLTLPVQPGWYDPTPLLGYVHPLRPEAYVVTPFLQFLMAAKEDQGRPYVVVLDEMNLSHPEQYMAPLLSAMETGERLPLHTADTAIQRVPPSLPYPSNLAIIGTVNMDETTQGLSDKVLDRAFVVEFWNVALDSYQGWKRDGLTSEQMKKAREVLTALMNALEPARLHFGWRVVDDVLGFLEHATAGGNVDFSQALDSVTYAKILPKLRGEDSPKFRSALADCEQALKIHQLERCAKKVAELASDLKATGSARFWR
ncbi:MAG: McrB family protein [Vicinamibacterales bacterium]